MSDLATTDLAAAPDPASPDSDLTQLVGYNLKRVVNLMQADLSAVLAAFGLRIISFSALMVVVKNPGINQTQLAEILDIERSNLVQIIDELSGRSLMARTPVAGDRRRHALMPTTEGLQVYAKAHDAVVAHEARVFGMLNTGERDTLRSILRKIRQNWGA